MLDVRDPVPAFFARMMACEAIASTSLSALILAEALGIPNLWLDFGSDDDAGARLPLPGLVLAGRQAADRAAASRRGTAGERPGRGGGAA